MTKILAADIGGTKTLIQLSELNNGQYHLLHEQRFSSQDYHSFIDMFSVFKKEAKLKTIDYACLGIAGPITNNGKTAQVTNLPWLLESDALCKIFSLKNISLINDFHAIALGIDSLTKDELLTLQTGVSQQHKPQLIVGAGTGLGVAVRLWNGSQYQVLASEAGHAGFSPANEQQRQLLNFLTAREDLVSRENVLSGQGLVNIYQFIGAQQENTADDLGAPQISQHAQQGDDRSLKALMLFFEIYGSECGNLALTTLPYSGLYLAGGIVAKNITTLKQSEFLNAFSNKGKMHTLLSNIPIHVIKNESVGLLGARWRASHP